MKSAGKLRYPIGNWRAFSVFCLIAIGFCVIQYEIYAQTKIIGKPRRTASVGSRPRNAGPRINRSYRLPNRGNLSPKFNARSSPGKTFRNSSSGRAAVAGSKSTFRNRQALRRNNSGRRYSNVSKRERLTNKSGLSRYGKATKRTGQYRPKNYQRAKASTKNTVASKPERKINTGRRSSNLRQRTDIRNKVVDRRRLKNGSNKAVNEGALVKLPHFVDKAAAFKHYAKHTKGIILGENGQVTLKKDGADTPMFKSLGEYVSGAQKFFNSKGNNILTKTRGSDIYRFDTNTGFFGIQRSSGTIITFFKPEEGINYYLKK